MRYDAFISYSHADRDREIAHALQRGLQRLAKPWWRRRSLRIFRDDAMLSASPSLRSSLDEALDESAFLIVVASPDSARSEWVGREIESWRQRKSQDKILLALGSGEWAWREEDDDFDWQRSAAMPQALAGAFRDEPRIVDLRWVDDPADLTLRHSRFRGQVAELAAAIHGRPKDEIEADDIKQHRRTLLAAWTASAALAVLTIAAVVAALLALNFAATARDNERQAAANATEARYQVSVAERNLKTAEEERRRAISLAAREVLERSNSASACDATPAAP